MIKHVLESVATAFAAESYIKTRRNNCLYLYVTQILLLVVCTVYDFSLAFSTCDVVVPMQSLVCNQSFTMAVLLELILYNGTATWITLSILYWANIGQFSGVVKTGTIVLSKTKQKKDKKQSLRSKLDQAKASNPAEHFNKIPTALKLRNGNLGASALSTNIKLTSLGK